MRKTWLIFVNSFQRMRLAFATSLAVGIALCVLTALTSSLIPDLGSNIKLGYIDQDNSALSSDFELYASDNLGIELVEGDIEHLNSELVEKHISAIVEVPAGFEQAVLSGKSGALQVTFMDDYLNKVFLQNYLEIYTSSVDMLAGAAGGDGDKFANLLDSAREQSVPVTTVDRDGQQAQRYQQWMAFLLSIGFFIFIAAMLIITLGNIIYDDKVNQTFKRVQATGISAISYVVGVCAAGFVATIIMVVIYLAYCALSGLGEIVNLWPVAVLSALFVLLCVGFALVCSLLLKSRNAIQWAAIATSSLCSLLGGVWFPITYAPDFLQKLAQITPQFWYIDAINRMHNGEPDAWIISAAIIALFAMLCFLIAGIRFASSKSSA